jgi:thioredoxin-like negative regulator of GroEL
LALAQLQLHRNAAAAATLEQGRLVAPEDVELHMLYARVLLEQNEIEHAYTLLRQGPQPQLSAKPDFYALRAALARQHGAYAEAAELYALLCQLNPSRGDWRLGLAISQHQLGVHAQALLNYQSAAANPQLEENLRAYAARQAQLLLP